MTTANFRAGTYVVTYQDSTSQQLVASDTQLDSVVQFWLDIHRNVALARPVAFMWHPPGTPIMGKLN